MHKEAEEKRRGRRFKQRKKEEKIDVK